MDAAGTLYGTTTVGGDYNDGTVFSLTKDGVLTTLVTFKNLKGADGFEPYGSLLADSSGVLYGTTYAGGFGGGEGTVFRLTDTGFKVPGEAPEPASWTMVITGLGLTGAKLRRRSLFGR